MLRLAANGGIGALATEDLEAEGKAGRGWDLVDPGPGRGRYRVNGRPGRQSLPVRSTLCVTALETATCPPETGD